MAQVRFTRNLNRFFPELRETEVRAGTVADLVRQLDSLYPGIASYVVDDAGSLRKHVNVFIGDEMIKDRVKLTDQFDDAARVFVAQALSGG